MTTPTAVRTTRNGKATIAVTLPDGSTENVGGARATRAAVVLVEDRPEGHRNRSGRYHVSCRADAEAAGREAERMSTATTRRTKYSWEPVPCTPIPTIVVPVTDVTDGEAARPVAEPELVTPGQLRAGDTIQLRKGAVGTCWDDTTGAGRKYADWEHLPHGVDVAVDWVVPAPLAGHRSPHGRRSRAYEVTSGGRTFRLQSAQKVLRVAG